MTAGLLLVGASGLAREVIAAGAAAVVGVLDDDPGWWGRDLGGVPVLGSTELAVRRGEQLIVCVGPSPSRRAVVRRLTSAGVDAGRFATFIAESARIGTTSTVGRGSIVLDGAVITADARVGAHVVAMPQCTITHDDVLEDFTTLASGVALGGGVHIGEAAYLGMNASVRQDITVGAECVIGMGAAVISDVPSGQTWAGVPARRLGEPT